MRSPILLGVAAFAAATWLAGQERVSELGERDFDALHRAVAEEFHSGHLRYSLAASRRLSQVIEEHRRETILAAFPVAPHGFEIVPPRGSANRDWTEAGAFGRAIGQRYRSLDGKGLLEITVTMDSPLLETLQLWTTNPSLLADDGDWIGYEQHDAALWRDGPSRVLQVSMHGALVEARVVGKGGEFLLRVLDQEVVTGLDRAIGR